MDTHSSQEIGDSVQELINDDIFHFKNTPPALLISIDYMDTDRGMQMSSKRLLVDQSITVITADVLLELKLSGIIFLRPSEVILGAHYFCCTRQEADKWFVLDDSKVQTFNADPLQRFKQIPVLFLYLPEGQ